MFRVLVECRYYKFVAVLHRINEDDEIRLKSLRDLYVLNKYIRLKTLIRNIPYLQINRIFKKISYITK